VAQLLPEIADVHVQASVVGHGAAPQYFLEQLLSRHNLARSLNKNKQKIELDTGELDDVACLPHDAGAGIQLDVIDDNASGRRPDCLGGDTLPGSAKNRVDAGEEFAGIEWLWEVVVRAEFETHDAVDVLPLGGKHEHRNVRFRPNAPKSLEAVHPREHDIEHDQIELLRQYAMHAVFRAVAHRQVDPFSPQELDEQVTESPVIIDDDQS
jgi:hypothetical protein